MLGLRYGSSTVTSSDGDIADNGLSSELQLLITFASLELDDEAISAIDSIIAAGVDWQQFLKLGNAHGLLPLSAYHVHSEFFTGMRRQIPGDVVHSLKQAFAASFMSNVRFGSEMGRITDLFEAASIPVMPYKGPSLAQRLYGDVALRPSVDLDLLIPSDAVTPACRILKENGFRPLQNFESERQEAVYTGHVYEYEFFHEEKRMQVELHWGVVAGHHPIRVGWPEIWRRAESSTGYELSDEDLFILLCVHAAKHQFLGLKWLLDLKILALKFDVEQWQLIIERARSWRARRTVLSAISLCTRLLQMRIPDEIEQAIVRDRAITKVQAQVIALFEKPADAFRDASMQVRFSLLLCENPLAGVRYMFHVLTDVNFQDVVDPGLSRFGLFRSRIRRLLGVHGIARSAKIFFRLVRSL